MRFNQFSYIPVSEEVASHELASLGFQLTTHQSPKIQLETFVRTCHFLTADTDFSLSNLIADWETDLLSFFQSDRELTADIFYQVALQVLGFVPHFDYLDLPLFIQQTGFPIVYDGSLANLHQLLATRTKSGNTLVDQLVSDGLIPEDNQYHFFNGKALATFSTSNLIREVVYVEAPIDTAKVGQTDLVKVSIIRPHSQSRIPAVLTNSPYHQGVNEKASDQALHSMEGHLAEKETKTIQVTDRPLTRLPLDQRALPRTQATEKLGHITSYSLNDYFLSRGFANIHVSGVGTLGSTGLMTSGDYQQVEGFKAVIDWLNGRNPAYTDHSRSQLVEADWANGKVATTGLSYLGTLSNALATTGVDGLEVVIAEAGISSWYDYYRENGLVTSPGGYPGEDLDSLTALTYSKSLQAGDYLRNQAAYTERLTHEREALDRASGDYNQYWHERNYLIHAQQVRCQVVFTHGSQDWNVKPLHVWNMFHALPATIKKHLFFHHGAHVYMNNWQSIDFRESMNALLCQALLGLDNGYQLPPVIWQDNQKEQTWHALSHFGGSEKVSFPLGEQRATISNHYDPDTFAAYGKAYPRFLEDLFAGKAQQVTIDLPVTNDLFLNGRAELLLRVRSSVAKGLLSAQLLDTGTGKRLAPIPNLKARNSLDNGRYHAQENLMELPFVEMPHRVVTKGYLNLQNRENLLTIQAVEPNQWLDLRWELQPTIYQLKKGDTLRLVLYTTDFECTIRDNSEWDIQIDLAQSQLLLPTLENKKPLSH